MKPKMENEKKGPSAYILAGLFLAGVLGLGAYLCNLSRQPLSRKLTLEPQPSATAIPGQEGTALPATSHNAPLGSTVDPAALEICGQSGAYTVLIMGSDAADMSGRPGSDLTRLARVNFSRRTVGIFALPRDLWVDVRSLGFQDPLIRETALGMVYHEAHERSVETEESGRMIDGAQASAQTILDNFRISSDHYVVIDLSQLPALIDAIGGLPIDIPERTTDPWIGLVIEAGPQILSGDQLMAYARAIPDSDFARIQRNNLILHALRQKLLDPSVVTELPALYTQFKETFVSDLSPQQILGLLCLLEEVPRQDIVMEQIKPEWTSPGPSNSLLWDKDKVFSALKQLDLIR